jgi:2-dehydro-3-deoxyphosphooctonate aldolase (KDO 8-P synthase)
MKKIVEIGYGKVSKVKIGGNLPLAYVGGPCAIETRDHALFMAEKISKICNKLEIPWVYKSCYDKDCRSSPKSFHGVGIDEGLKILSEVRDSFGVPVVSDFSDPSLGSCYW